MSDEDPAQSDIRIAKLEERLDLIVHRFTENISCLHERIDELVEQVNDRT